ncbi:MAG: SufD family Fe-S cluster assembly protein [Tissierellia bacterium]|nr:SufD family Fe-S cluster assembly protein [Tissierellia bacterium]
MKKIIGNKLAFPTFRWIKVNKTEISIPELKKIDYPIESNGTMGEMPFKNQVYGVSEDALTFLKEYNNLYRRYETKEGEEVSYPPLYLKTDDVYTQLQDCHDIIAEKDSKIRVVLDYYSTGTVEKFRNTLIRILAKENADVELFIIQKENHSSYSLESIVIETEENATCHVRQYHLGSKKLYTNYQCDLIGDGSSSYLNSIYFGDCDDELNLLYNMIHHGEKTESDIIVHGALKDRATKNFKSNLEFKEGAKEAIGSEEEDIILLDDDVHSVSVPLMLCHEDNVVGNHAASCGKIDPEVLFYITSRGIDIEEAEALIIESKFAHAIDTLHNKELEEEVWEGVRKIIKEGELCLTADK